MTTRTTPAAPHPQYRRLGAEAGRIGVTPRTLRRWIDQGLITGYRIGPRLIYLNPAEIDAIVLDVPSSAGGN